MGAGRARRWNLVVLPQPLFDEAGVGVFVGFGGRWRKCVVTVVRRTVDGLEVVALLGYRFVDVLGGGVDGRRSSWNTEFLI